MVDGVSGTDVLAVIMDLSPDQEPITSLPWHPEPAPSGLRLALDASIELLRSPYEQFNAFWNAASVPRQALGQARSLARGLTAMTGLVKRTAPTSLNGPLGPHRRYGWASTTVEDIKAIRNELGGTFNDVVLAAITNGFRELLLERGESVDRVVRTLVPVSVRPRDDKGKAVGDGTLQNRVSAMFAELPVSIVDAPGRLRAVSRQMEGLKVSHQAMAGEALTSMTGFAPPMLLALGMRVSTRMAQHQVNTVTTNVPGPQIPLYMCGRRMMKAFPYVPLGVQMRIGVAIFSYNGEVSFGVTGDYDTTGDLDVLCRGIEEGIRQMRKAHL
jgi:diacylglycerol O-acyltransferase